MESETAPKSSIPMIPRLASTNGARAASNLNSAGAQKSSTFLWDTCTALSQEDRVDIKQQAVLDGFRLGEKLSGIIRNRFDRQKRGVGAEELADWADQLDNAKELYRTPHATVGLIGVIGSGKSTLLNAIIGERDLLPTSSDRAGTAVACKVVYNHGPEGYRAQILFRSRQSFTDELDKLFQNLKAKRELTASIKEASDDAEQQDIDEQLDDIAANTSATLGLLRDLCGLEEEDLGFTSGKDFLDAIPLGALGTTVKINENDRDKFLAETKPFIDSTSGDVENEEMPLWPLIEHVTIFVKSEVLKYGLELVDLPGLEDAVESRSEVATRFARHLDITAIIAPAIRAMEEKGVMGFIKRKQQNEMRMNGKFDPNSICVVISKSEDLVAIEYLGRKSVAESYPHIPSYLDEAKRLDSIIRNGGAEFGTNAKGAAALLEKSRDRFSSLADSLKQVAVSIRNRVVSERIQKDFRERQIATNGSSGDNQFHTANVEVFATSARALQAIRYPGGVQEAGFPTERHTGIPQFRKWLFVVTMEKRERHLDAVLNLLSGLFIRIHTWVYMNEGTTSAPPTALPYLDSIHEQYRQSIFTVLREFGRRLRRIDPLRARKAAITKCKEDYPRKVDRWGYRFPDKTNSTVKVPPAIQTCILRKRGEYHKSQGKYPYEYQWVDDLASVFTDKIIHDWHRTFLLDVPGYGDLIEESLEALWRHYGAALHKFCVDYAALPLRDTLKVHQAVGNAEKYLEISARKTLARLRTSAQDIHPIFRQELKRIMEPVFEEAHSITEKGCVRKRENLMKAFAVDNSKRMATKACKKMEVALEDLIQLHASALEGLAADAVSKVERQMELLLRTSRALSGSKATRNREMLEEEISPHLASWKRCWQKPSNQMDDHIMRGEFGIPCHELLEVEG